MRRRSLLRSLAPLAVLAGSGVVMAGCGGGSGDTTPGPVPGPPPAPAPVPAPPPGPSFLQTFVYVANSGSSNISIYQLDSTGALHPAGTVDAGAGAIWLAVHPFGNFAYAVNEDDNSITVYQLNRQTGTLTFRDRLGTGPFPRELRFHPSGNFAYLSTSGDHRVTSYIFEPDTGALLSTESHFVRFASGLAVHPAGYLYAGGELVPTFSINPGTGRLTQIDAELAGLDPESIAISPSGMFAYVASATDDLTIHLIEGAGSLGAGTRVDVGTGARSVAIDPSGRFAYVASPGNDALRAYTIDSGTGLLTSAGITDTSQPSSVAVAPSGQFLYVANRGDNTVSAYAIHQVTGALTAMGTPLPTGNNPSGITVVDTN